MQTVRLSTLEYTELSFRNPDYQGREANLYRVGKQKLYKLYHNPHNYSEKRLEELLQYQPIIQHTKFPLGSIHFGNLFIGVILKEYKDARLLRSLQFSHCIHYKIRKLKELIDNIQELTEHGIVLSDFYSENAILTKKNEVRLVDVDGDNIKLLNNPEELITLLRQLRSTILEICFPIQSDNHFKEIGFTKEKQQLFLGDKICYELLEELLNYFEKDQIISNYQKKFL